MSLPFGLHSTPKIFSAMADELAWCLTYRGVCCQLHYLDDFLFLGPPHNANHAVALETCRELGMPVAMEKVEGPSTSFTFLGIQIDTQGLELSLPSAKLVRIQSLVSSWSKCKTASRPPYSHAATVVPPGCSFIQCLIKTAKKEEAPPSSNPAQYRVSFRPCGGQHSSVSGMDGLSCLPPVHQ